MICPRSTKWVMAYLAKTMPRTLYWWSDGTRPHIALYVNPILLALVDYRTSDQAYGAPGSRLPVAVFEVDLVSHIGRYNRAALWRQLLLVLFPSGSLRFGTDRY